MTASFRETLSTHVEPILHEYNITHARTRHGSMFESVDYESERVRVSFVKEDRDGFVLVDFVELEAGQMLVYDSVADRIEECHGGFGLSRLLGLRAPALNEELETDPWPPPPDYYLRQVPIIARALDLHCRDVLAGDFSVRKEVLNRARSEYESQGLVWPQGWPREKIERMRSLPDEALRAAVDRAIGAMKGIDSSQVSIEVSNGVISLSGSIETLRQKELVEGAAYSILSDRERFASTVRIRQGGRGHPPPPAGFGFTI